MKYQLRKGDTAFAIGQTNFSESKGSLIDTNGCIALSVISGYATAFCLLSLSLKTIPVGIAYAIWAAVGIVLIAIIGAIAFKQTPDLPALIGLVLIIAGVIIINVFSKMSVH